MLFPPAFLLAIAGLALLPALTSALREISAGPLVLGPLFAFAIALSDMQLFGLDSFFWSLVLGTLVSALSSARVAPARVGAGVRVGDTRSTGPAGQPEMWGTPQVASEGAPGGSWLR